VLHKKAVMMSKNSNLFDDALEKKGYLCIISFTPKGSALMYKQFKRTPLSPRLIKVLKLLPFFFGTFLFGTVGLHITDNLTFFESFYMTLITVSTVGFGELKSFSTSGRIIIMIVIVCSMTIVTYTIGSFLRMMIEGELARTFGRRKLEKTIASLKDHFILCGYGRIGRLIALDLRDNGIPFVVIEHLPEAIEQLEKDKMLFVDMDATAEESLLTAGIMRAKGLVTAVKSDSDNVFITLTARSIHPGIFILSRGSDERNEEKLRRAGATRVALPYQIGGKRMSQMLLRPTVVDFIDVAMMDSDLGLQMEELTVKKGSIADKKNLVESNIRRVYGIIIVAVKKQDGKMVFNPAADECLEAGDTLVVLGKKEDLLRLEKSV
jgi:voltage-gated potassium channel